MTANKEQDDSGGTLGGDECWILPVEKGSRTNSPPPPVLAGLPACRQYGRDCLKEDGLWKVTTTRTRYSAVPSLPYIH